MMKFFTLWLFILSFSLNADNYGGLLLYGNCTTCHHMDKSISAPSMKIIKKILVSFSTKKRFCLFYV